MDINNPLSSAWVKAQQSVIGSLLIDPEHVAGEIFQRARPEQFGDASLRHIFEAARGLWNERRTLDPVTILDAAGGQYEQLLGDLMRVTPTAAHVSEYLTLIESGRRMSLLRAAAMDLLETNSADAAAEIWDRIGQQLLDTEEVEDLSWTECVHGYLDRMNDRTPPQYLSWGIPELDKYLTVSPGMFVILAADSSVGKTALALQFAYHMASTGRRVGFVSLETTQESLTNRLMAETQVAGIEMKRSKWKTLTKYDFRSASEAGQKSAEIPLRIIRNADTVERIRARVIQRRFDVVFIDYLQLLQAEGRSRAEVVTQISMQLHRMAQLLGVVVVGLSQITPPDKGSSRRLTKDDLRESRQLKHDADVIMLMTPAEDGNKNLRELNVDKNKDDRTGRLLLSFDPQHMSFIYTPPKGKPQKTPPMFEEMGEEEGGALPF